MLLNKIKKSIISYSRLILAIDDVWFFYLYLCGIIQFFSLTDLFIDIKTPTCKTYLPSSINYKSNVTIYQNYHTSNIDYEFILSSGFYPAYTLKRSYLQHLPQIKITSVPPAKSFSCSGLNNKNCRFLSLNKTAVQPYHKFTLQRRE